MVSKAMIVVAGGTATRFGGDKLMTEIGGRPLIAHTVERVAASADITVVATRTDLVEQVKDLDLGVVVTAGGETRTDSELAGLTALGAEFDLIGIHDGARPLVTRELVDLLYRTADDVGGAVPVIDVETPLVERRTLRPVRDAVRVQTPQVFRGPELLAAYVRAAQTAFAGHDTVDVIHQFSDIEIAAVPGDAANIKVTYPQDLDIVRKTLEDPSRSGPH